MHFIVLSSFSSNVIYMMHTCPKTLKNTLYKYSYSIKILGRRIKTDIPNIYERSAHMHYCVSTCSDGLSCIFTHHWKHLFLHKVYEILIEIWRECIKKYIPSCLFITYRLNLSFLRNPFWLHSCANPIWIFYEALE